MTCPEDHVLIALGDGELTESQAHAVRAHAGGCTRCRAALDELATIAADLRAPVPGALGGKTAEAFADDVLARIDRPRTEARAPRWPRWAAMLAAAAMLPLAGAAAYRWSRANDDAREWTARGTTSATSVASRVLVRIGRVSGTTFEPIAEGETIDADALLAAEVGGTEGASLFLLAFLVDAAGERHWIYPVYEPGAPPPSSVALPATMTPRVLGSMVRLDRPAPGPARLFAVVLPRSESVEHVEHAPLEELSRARLSSKYEGSLVVVTPVEIRP